MVKINYNENKFFKHSNLVKLEYIGKCLLLGEAGERVLVIGDLHLGYEGAMRASGVMVPVKLYEKCLSDFKEIISFTGNVDKIVVLGDVKHEFGYILSDEWNLIKKFLIMLKEYCNKLVIIEGNHDAVLFPIMKELGIESVDFFRWNSVIFAHGDKKFDEMNDSKIMFWVLGHGHPAIVLRERGTRESYKCFLNGLYKGKKVILVPSFFPLITGTDAREFDLGYPFEFKLNNFEVFAVGDKLEVFKFGKLGKLKI